jgi:hypothetical protein
VIDEPHLTSIFGLNILINVNRIVVQFINE